MRDSYTPSQIALLHSEAASPTPRPSVNIVNFRKLDVTAGTEWLILRLKRVFLVKVEGNGSLSARLSRACGTGMLAVEMHKSHYASDARPVTVSHRTESAILQDDMLVLQEAYQSRWVRPRRNRLGTFFQRQVVFVTQEGR